MASDIECIIVCVSCGRDIYKVQRKEADTPGVYTNDRVKIIEDCDEDEAICGLKDGFTTRREAR